MLLAKPFVTSDSLLAIIRGSNRAELIARMQENMRTVDEQTIESLSSVLSRLSVGNALNDRVVAIVVSSSDDLAAKLERATRQLAEPKRSRINDRTGIYFFEQPLGRDGKVALLFPGEGSQYENALADLIPEFPELRDVVAQTPAGDPAMWDMVPAIRMVLLADVALLQILQTFGFEPDVIAGHSTGEIAALYAAKTLRAGSVADLAIMLEDLASLTSPEVMEQMGSARLVAAGTDRETAQSLMAGIEPLMVIAMNNCPHQTVIVGDDTSAATLVRKMQEQGIMHEILPFDRPYHTERCKPLATAIRETYESWIVNVPQIPVYSCTAASRFPADLPAVHDLAVDQWTSRVEFPDTVEALYAEGVRIFVESGPRGNLSAFVDDILRGRPHAAIPSNVAQRSGAEQLVHLVAQLIAHGVRLGPRVGGAQSDVRQLEVSQNDTSRRQLDTDATTPAIAAHMAFMDRFYGAQKKVMLAYLDKRREVAASAEPRLLPLIGTILSFKPREQVIALREFNIDEDLFLRSHTFGRNVSQSDPSLAGLPIMPLTMSIEMMAEAASLLCPDLAVVSVDHIHALRWATSDTGRFTLRVEARRSNESPRVVEVRLYEQGIGEGEESRDQLIADATVRFGERTSPPAPRTYAGIASRTSIDRSIIYTEMMFHGPRFAGTVRVDAIADDGADTTIEVLPRDDLLFSNPDPYFLIDPVLLDNAGQSLGFWMFKHGGAFPMAFPLRIGSIEVHGSLPQPRTLMRCSLSDAALSDSQVSGDVDISTPDGTLHLRVNAWESRRFDVPGFYTRHWYAPREFLLCSRWPEAESLASRAGAAGAHVLRISTEAFPANFFEAYGGIWLRSLALTILSRREREAWLALRTPPLRKTEWLLGRSAAKDAVRSFLKERFGVIVPPADIEIDADVGGRPCAGGAWVGKVPFIPGISISHSAGTAVAIAVGQDCSGIGIDLQHASGLNDDVIAAGFTDAERRGFDDVSDGNRMELPLRTWCAKEAATKAVGDVASALTEFDGEFALAVCATNVSKGIGVR